MVNRKIRADARIKAKRVGGDPFDLTLLLEELDCLHVKTREVVTALVIQTEELAGIVHARLPTAEQGDHGASSYWPMLFFPGLNVIGRELGVRLYRSRRTNVHHDQRTNELFGGNEVGAPTLRAVQWGIDMGAAVFLYVPAVGIPLVLPQLADLLKHKRVGPGDRKARAERIGQIHHPLKALRRRRLALGQ